MIRSSDAQQHLEKALSTAGFVQGLPDPRLAWAVFKAFSSAEVDCQDDALLWQCGVYNFSGTELFHWNMTRQFTFEEDGEYERMEHLSFTIYYPAAPKLQLLETNVWSYDFSSREAFFASVESLPAFRIPIEQHSPTGSELYHEQV